LAFILGFVLHFILDIIPHGDEKLGKKFFGIELGKFRQHDDFKPLALYGSLDACFLAIFLAFMFKNFAFTRADNVIWAILGGIIPDILVALYKLYNVKPLKWFYDLHNANHWILLKHIKKDLPVKYGIVWQALIFIFMIWLLFTI
jgi:hypothetical protein